jgi:hypothetical protein
MDRVSKALPAVAEMRQQRGEYRRRKPRPAAQLF